ncbi:MAG: hypothetical protein QOI66_3904 [Myxococcales bacterium]|nr:hypothetical protein [Myxococcales bacterium]
MLPTVNAARDWLQRSARTTWFRLAFALLCLAAHLAVNVQSGKRFGMPFNAAPGAAPAYVNPGDGSPARWNRLVVSRWDAGSYVGLGLRGYSQCPPTLDPKNLAPAMRICNLAFYPSYALVGWLLSFGGRLAIDYVLWGISLGASLIFLFLWTGDTLVSRLGLWETYLSLILLNTFTTGFSLVTVQTEPLTLAATLGSFIALHNRRFFLAAILAGFATGLRITALSVGGACALAILIITIAERPLDAATWAKRILQLVLCFWGEIVLATYHAIRFGDPLIYIHAHGQAFKHESPWKKLLDPQSLWFVRSIEHPLHEGVWLVAALLWFLLGHRKALGRFPVHEQAFWYALFIGTLVLAGIGVLPLSFVGMNRYVLLALPLFLAMAAMMKNRPTLLVFWIVISLFHYWNVDLCEYTGGPGNRTLEVCHTPHWIGRI